MKFSQEKETNQIFPFFATKLINITLEKHLKFNKKLQNHSSSLRWNYNKSNLISTLYEILKIHFPPLPFNFFPTLDSSVP